MSCILIDTEVTVKIPHREVAPGHITDAPTEAHHATDTQTLIVTNGTHHIGGLPHIEALLVYSRDCSRSRPCIFTQN